MSSLSDSSATEYRRRLPEVPRAVKFSGDVLNRIEDVAEKIDHVGNRMRHVENIMSDYQDMPLRDGREVPIRVMADERCELTRLRDEVNKTLNRFEGISAEPHYRSIYPGSYERKLETQCIRNSLEKLNKRICDSEVEKSIHRDELTRTRVELEQAKVDAKKGKEEEERSRKLQTELRNTEQRENHLTQHLNAVTERADTVTGRNQELQNELVDSQMESTRLRKDCTQLVQEIEKLRQEQIDDKKRFSENERLTAQLGRQLAEQRSDRDKLETTNAEVQGCLREANAQNSQLSNRLESAEDDKVELQNQIRSMKEALLNASCDLNAVKKNLEVSTVEGENSKLREISLRSELDSVRQRNGELETLKQKLSSNSEDANSVIIKLEAENEGLTARLKDVEIKLQDTYSKLVESEHVLNANKNLIGDIKARNSALDSKIQHFEHANRKDLSLRAALEEELAALKATNFEIKQTNHDLTAEITVERSKRESNEKELAIFQERFKCDQKLNSEQMSNIVKEMEESDSKHRDAMEECKQKYSNESKFLQDQITETKAELSSIKDEAAHQRGKCASMQQRLREAEMQLNAKNNDFEELQKKFKARETSFEKMKENGGVVEDELLKSRREMAQLDILVKRSCAIARTGEKYEELPLIIEKLQCSNDTFKTKTQQIALELEKMKIRNEKQAREYQAQRRGLIEELSSEKDRNLAARTKMTAQSAENEDLKIEIKSLKDKFEILAEEIETSRMKSELRALQHKP